MISHALTLGLWFTSNSTLQDTPQNLMGNYIGHTQKIVQENNFMFAALMFTTILNRYFLR